MDVFILSLAIVAIKTFVKEIVKEIVKAFVKQTTLDERERTAPIDSRDGSENIR